MPLLPETGISGGVDRREAQRLRRRNQQLEEENNLLRLKVDILLDMVRRAAGGDALAFPGQLHHESFQPAHTLECQLSQAQCSESKDTRPRQTQSPPSRAQSN